MDSTQRNLIAAIPLRAAVMTPDMDSAVAMSGLGAWEATRQACDLDSSLAAIESHYDAVLDIAWLFGAGRAA